MHVAAAAPSSGTKSDSKSDGFVSRLTRTRAPAATIAGFLEIGCFHPFDTIAKRLMANQGSISAGSFRGTMSNVNQVIFKAKANESVMRKILYLYPGSTYAIVYKVLQRIYKFAGQPLVRDHLSRHYDSSFQRWFGRGGRVMREGTAGCLIGMGEVILLPLDRLKVLSQVNEHAMRGGLLPLLRKEGFRGMYTGTGITICRNAPGSFSLFGGAALAKHCMNISDQSDRRGSTTIAQNMIASFVGACLSITISNPMDVIKTRMQNTTAESRRSTTAAIRAVLREEGVLLPFFKGLTPKLIASAPKLIFTYTVTEYLYEALQRKH